MIEGYNAKIFVGGQEIPCTVKALEWDNKAAVSTPAISSSITFSMPISYADSLRLLVALEGGLPWEGGKGLKRRRR